MLDLISSFKVLKGFPVAKTKTVKSQKDLTGIKFPYFMKASISGHKLEKKAVARINNLDEAKKFFSHLEKNFRGSDVIIQEEIDGIEMVIGLKEDKVFGKLLLVGFGGSNIEILKDIAFRALPLSKEDIKSAVVGLRLYPSLYKRKKYATSKFIDLAYKVSRLPVKEMDLNPVVLTEKNAVIVDARIEN
jgi:acetate---CoA ligase (ADP-forming)